MGDIYFWYAPKKMGDIEKNLKARKNASTQGLKIKFVVPDGAGLALDLMAGEPFLYTKESSDYMEQPDGVVQTRRLDPEVVVVILNISHQRREYVIGDKTDGSLLTLKDAQRTRQICEWFGIDPPYISGIPENGLKTPDLKQLTSGILPPKLKAESVTVDQLNRATAPSTHRHLL